MAGHSGIRFAELLQFLVLGGDQPVVAFAGVRLGRANPAAQRFLVDAQVPDDVRDRPARGADLADGPLAELVRVCAWCRHCSWFSFVPGS
jgi:hypothetical protein